MADQNAKEIERGQVLLDGAIKKLEIQSVIITESKTFLKDGFGATEDQVAKNYVTQAFVKPTMCGTSEDKKQYGFKVAAGIRLVHQDDVEKSRESESDEFTCVEVRAHFMSLYSASGILTEDEENVFHEKNVIFHVWPYWREFVQQMAWRMGVPYLQVRMLKQNSLSKVTK